MEHVSVRVRVHSLIIIEQRQRNVAPFFTQMSIGDMVVRMKIGVPFQYNCSIRSYHILSKSICDKHKHTQRRVAHIGLCVCARACGDMRAGRRASEHSRMIYILQQNHVSHCPKIYASWRDTIIVGCSFCSVVNNVNTHTHTQLDLRHRFQMMAMATIVLQFRLRPIVFNWKS